MAPSLLHPPSYLSPASALQLSQLAPAVLRSSPESISSSPLAALFSTPETPELWITFENLLLSCLRTGDDESAHRCLERLVLRFGDKNERIMAFKGLIKEAGAENNAALDKVLKEYDGILQEEPNNIPIAKRRIALLRSLGRVPDAVSSLIALLDMSPTDAEGWAELADLYLSQGLYPQAIYALEEVLVLSPNAWNLHARLGEVLYMAATAQSTAGESSSPKYMAEATKRFCRSVELCDDYLRGYYGLKLVTSRLLKEPSNNSSSSKSTKTAVATAADSENFSLPDTRTIERLNELATQKLAEIVRRASAQERGWRGYDEGEIRAARELLAQDAPTGVAR